MPQVRIGSLAPFDHESLTVNGATTLTATKYLGIAARELAAIITVETDQIRYWLDGTAPEAAVGHLLNPGDSMVLENRSQLAGFKAIKVTNNATIRVSYLKR